MPKCFIITPYGEKKDASGKTINFDEAFNALSKRSLGSVGSKPFEAIKISKVLKAPIDRLQPVDIENCKGFG
jgi:hypothetical protein